MKKLVILLLFASTINYSQIEPVVPDFLINSDNNPSTFSQSRPQLWIKNDSSFFINWQDARNGGDDIYSQYFNNAGEKVGINVNSAFRNISFNQPGYSLRIEEEQAWTSMGSTYDIYLLLFNPLNIPVARKHVMSGTFPECGTGYISGEEILTPSKDGFYFLSNRAGSINLAKMSNSGNIELLISDPPYGPMTNISSAAAGDSDYFFAWKKTLWSDFDTLRNGLYATFYKGSKFQSTVFLDSLNYVQDTYPASEDITLKAITLNDSLYKLYWLNNRTMMLYSVVINREGIKSNTDSMQIMVPANVYGSSLSITNKVNGTYYLNITSWSFSDYPLGSQVLIKYDINGNMTGSAVYGTSGNINNNNLFYRGEDKFFAAQEKDKDIFLVSLNLFKPENTEKINDDFTGSNESNYSLIKYDDNSAFSVWWDENGYYGTRVYNNGSVNQEKVSLKSSNVKFFSTNDMLETWIQEDSNYNYYAGYTIYNKDFVKTDSAVVAAAASYYNLDIESIITDSSNFIIKAGSASGIKLMKISNKTGVIKQLNFETPGYYTSALTADKDSILFLYNNTVRQYSDDLVPGKAFSITRDDLSGYIGKGRFLYMYDWSPGNDENSSLYAQISNIRDTNIVSIRIADINPSNFYASGIPVDDNRIFIVYISGNVIYGAVISASGDILKKPFLVTTYEASSVKKWPAVTISGSKLYISWADVRSPGKGYDIYGNIFDLDELVDVPVLPGNKQIPGKFSLAQNFPNPFNPATKIRFTLPELYRVVLKVYDILGKEVATLVNEEKPAGYYEADFNAVNLASGIYYYRISAGSFSETRKMLLIK